MWCYVTVAHFAGDQHSTLTDWLTDWLAPMEVAVTPSSQHAIWQSPKFWEKKLWKGFSCEWSALVLREKQPPCLEKKRPALSKAATIRTFYVTINCHSNNCDWQLHFCLARGIWSCTRQIWHIRYNANTLLIISTTLYFKKHIDSINSWFTSSQHVASRHVVRL